MAVQAVTPAGKVRTRANWGRRLLIAIVTLAGLAGLVVAGLSIYVAGNLSSAYRVPVDPAVAATIGTNYSDVTFPSRQQVTLKGWLFHADNNTAGRSVIMVHGWHHNRIDTSYHTDKIANDLLQHGYDVLLFDLSACGESAGDHFTLATKEYLDVLGAYDFMKSDAAGTTYNPHKMAVIGDSMGAAATLRATPEMPDVGAIVADSAFAELRPILEKELPARSPLPTFFTQPTLWAVPLYGLDPNLRPVDAVRAQPNRAFLFFHGLADDFVPPSNADELRAASTNPDSALVRVPGAKHVRTYEADPAAYMQRVYQFFDKEMGQ
jgi:alpha-beta hydrolase superfamily lysophospholipase